tara:strand:- start:621 stop:1154 length:534 start_codon:yes stop_codon:yes gene_type:complete
MYYIDKTLYLCIIFAASLYSILGLTRVDLLGLLNDYSQINIRFILSIFFAIAILNNVTRRDYYLPFMGKMIFPCDSFVERFPENATLSVDVKGLPPNRNVIFWATESNTNLNITNPIEAYDKYANTGITSTNKFGETTFKVRPPIEYVIHGSTIKKHIHYRVCLGNGVLGRLNKVNV